jgi:exonuclease I
MSPFLTDEDINPEEKKKIIEQIADKIYEYKMETMAIVTLESMKPLTYIGGEMSRFFLAPILPILGHNLNEAGEKYIAIFEDRKNIEKLIQLLEQKIDEEKKDKDEKSSDSGQTDEKRKKGLLKWWPFFKKFRH